MPIRQGTTTRKGKKVGYYQWGRSGKRYTYKLGSAPSKRRARAKAGRQAAAIKASQGRRKKKKQRR